MTITEILDGLAELGRLRLERERAGQAVAALAQTQDAGKTLPKTDHAESDKAAQNANG